MVAVLERVLVPMTDQVVGEKEEQPGPGPSLPQTQEPPSGSFVETPEDRARRREIDEQKRREEIRRFFPPGYGVSDHLPVRTIGKLKRR